MANFQNQTDRNLFSEFLLTKMQEKHQTPEGFAAKAKVDIRTLRSYLDGSFSHTKLNQVFTFLEELDVEFSEFERFLRGHTLSGSTNQRFSATSGPTININEGNTISDSPIGTQGNITFNQYSKGEE